MFSYITKFGLKAEFPASPRYKEYAFTVNVRESGRIYLHPSVWPENWSLPTGVRLDEVLAIAEDSQIECPESIVSRYSARPDSGEYDGPDFLNFFVEFRGCIKVVVVSRKELEKISNMK